jgi:hypothetical protein
MNRQKPRFSKACQKMLLAYTSKMREMYERCCGWQTKLARKRLRESANKRDKYNPDRKLFVSALVKRFQLKVPPAIYAPVKVPIFRVYVLVLKDYTKLKIGFTGSWPDRAYAFVKTAAYWNDFKKELTSLFDTMQSLAFDAGSESEARLLEVSLKAKYAASKVASPYETGRIPYGSSGHDEWFDYGIYEDLIASLSPNRHSVSLEESKAWSDALGVTEGKAGPE